MAEAFNRDGLEGMRPYLHPEIEYHEDPSFPEGGVHHGIQAYETYARQFLQEFSEISYDVGEVIGTGDDLVANLLIHGVGKASGAEFEISAWWGVQVRDGVVVRCFAYLDRDRALEAVGLAEG